jgi:phage gp29-like protein
MASVPALVDRYGRPLQRKLLTQEIAAPSITGVRSPFTGYPTAGLNPRRLASLLRMADQGDPLGYFELAEEIEEKDAHYLGVLGTRKRSVAQLEITVEAASDDKQHVAHADLIRSWLKRKILQAELRDILDAIGKGVSFTEIMWDTSSGQWWPRALKWRDPRSFVFDRVDGATPLLRVDPAVDTWATEWARSIGWTRTDAVPLPPFTFIYAVIAAKSGLPVRSGVARVAAWLWMFKAFTQRDWAIFTQTYGQPVRVGKYGPGASDTDKDTLLRAVANIAGDCAAIVPASMLIEFVESKNVGPGNDLYLQRCDWIDRQLSKLVVGQTATTDAEIGGLGSGKEHGDVRADIEAADASDLGAILNRDLVKCWIDLEYGPQDAYPELRIGRAEKEDLKQLADSLDKLVPLGLEVQMSEVRDRFGFSEPAPGAKLLRAPAAVLPEDGRGRPGAPTDALAKPPTDPALQASAIRQDGRERPGAAARATDAVDHLAAATDALTQPASDAIIEAVRALVMRASSFAELQAGLKKLDLPRERFAELLSMAMVMADLTGRAEIAGGANA